MRKIIPYIFLYFERKSRRTIYLEPKKESQWKKKSQDKYGWKHERQLVVQALAGKQNQKFENPCEKQAARDWN